MSWWRYLNFSFFYTFSLYLHILFYFLREKKIHFIHPAMAVSIYTTSLTEHFSLFSLLRRDFMYYCYCRTSDRHNNSSRSRNISAVKAQFGCTIRAHSEVNILNKIIIFPLSYNIFKLFHILLMHASHYFKVWKIRLTLLALNILWVCLC
jgi:hypothetical protein